MEQRYDVAVIGGGIVGLSLAAALLDRRPQVRLALLEKESGLAEHQTGHNSGVLHSGIYYRPGSLRAQLCVEGARRMAEFCVSRGLPIARCGKVIVATEEAEVPGLADLYKRGVANGVPGLEMLDPKQLHAIEPHAFGIQAIHCPSTAVLDFQQVARELARDIRARGAEILTHWPVKRIRTSAAGWRLASEAGELTTQAFVNCAGLHADRIAALSGMTPDVQIVPFRGEYFRLSPEGAALVRGLIYPVPDGREAYRKHSVSVPDVLQFVAYPGFWRMARKYWKTAGLEMRRSMRRNAFVRSVQRLVPDIRDQDLKPGGCGIRAQAVARDGSLVDDFRLIQTAGAIHVLNAPSPAATASLEIASRLAEMAIQSFNL